MTLLCLEILEGREKIEKYQYLRREVAKLWKVKTTVFPIVVVALGVMTVNLTNILRLSE